MKNLMKMATMLVLVTVMGVSSTFGGVYLSDRQNVPAPPPAPTCDDNGNINTGVIIGGVIIGGVIIGGVIIGGVIIGGAGSGVVGAGGEDVPCELGSTD